MKETLPKSSFLRDKVAKPAAGLAIVGTSLGIGGCSPKESYLVELSVGVRCSEGVDGASKPAVEQYVNNINGSKMPYSLPATFLRPLCHTPTVGKLTQSLLVTHR